jgi:hypothetical protein
MPSSEISSKTSKKALESEELSESKITQGLKEALRVGTSNAVNMVSKVDGYYKNPKIRIPLPNAVQKTEKVLRAVGYAPPGGRLRAKHEPGGRAGSS